MHSSSSCRIGTRRPAVAPRASNDHRSWALCSRPMLLGAHESTAGGLHEAFARALADGAEAVQIFTKSSRMWRAKEITAADVAQFRAAATLPVSVHASYLVNLGAGPGDLREKSIAAFVDELQRCDLLGIPHLVVHPGANPDKPRGLGNVSEALDRVFAAHRRSEEHTSELQ